MKSLSSAGEIQMLEGRRGVAWGLEGGEAVFFIYSRSVASAIIEGDLAMKLWHRVK